MDLIHRLLYLRKFVIFKFQSISNVDAEWKQCNRNLRNDTGLIVFYISVIATNINYSTQHSVLLCENPPLENQGRVIAS